MAAVRVTSDRAVLGDLPAVCVRTGAPADAYVTVVTKVGGPSPWTLALVFFGPLGWLVLAGISLAMGEDLSVRLPFSAAAWDSIRRVALTGYVMLGAGVAGVVASLLIDPERRAISLAALLGLAGGVVVVMAKAMLPRIRLDATRSWATLRHVHPGFRDAVLAEPASDRADS
ncbi:MAG: hypothetical protein ACHQIG_05615 [Acidimicrobiia bacterium]